MLSLAFRAGILLLLLLLIQGCSTSEPNPVHTKTYSKSLGRIAVRIENVNTPKLVRVEFDKEGKDEGVVEGMGEGILQCMAQTGGIPVLGAIICVPLGTVVGGTVGGVQAESGKKVITAKHVIEAAVAETNVTDGLRNAIQSYLEENGLDFPVIDDRNDSGGFETYIDIIPKRILIRSPGDAPIMIFGTFSVKTKMSEAATGKEIDAFTFKAHLGSYTFDKKEKYDVKKVKAFLNGTYREIAENCIDEVILIYRPEEAQSDRGRVPGYTLQPLYPPVVESTNPLMVLGTGVDASEIDTLNPVFKWDPLPPDLSTPAYKGRISDVTYDLRIYGGGENREARNIDTPYYRFDTPLKADTSYTWTVRARFRLDGEPRATEWMGAYDIPIGTIEPWYWRRSTYPPMYAETPNWRAYLPFHTPKAEKNGTKEE